MMFAEKLPVFSIVCDLDNEHTSANLDLYATSKFTDPN